MRHMSKDRFADMMLWFSNKVRDIARCYSDADIMSMRGKLISGKKKFTHREHSAFVDKILPKPDADESEDK
jgi:hypothetical protein